MEKFLLSERNLKFEMWQAVLAALFVFLGLIGFGAFVDRGARHGDPDPVSIGANMFARIPATTKDVAEALLAGSNPERVMEQRFDGQAGFIMTDLHEETGDLLLLSRFNAARNRSTLEVIDVDTGAVLHDYYPDVPGLKQRVRRMHKRAGDAKIDDLDVNVRYRPNEYDIVHPIMEPDGSLLFKDFDTPMVKIDACARTQWVLYGAFHHALEQDADGHYWTVVRQVPPSLAHVVTGFEDDSLVQLSSDGDILFQKSLAEILLENDLPHMVYPFVPYNEDPFHLNDVEPVLSDGPYWKRGDVFLSARNQSTLYLYRPASNEIVWYRRGPWMAQHDVDILNQTQISIFNNNTAGGIVPDGQPEIGQFVVGSNEANVYDFETDTVTSPYKAAFEQHDIRTPIEGLLQILPNGDIWVEETFHGRVLMMSPAGDIKWAYVNRGPDGKVYGLQWGRYVHGEDARTLRDRIARGFDCN